MRPTPKITLASLWGLAGVVLLLGGAVARLAPIAWRGIDSGLAGWQWAALLGIVVFMGYSEGYRGFQKGFSPRVAARVRYLATHPSLPRSLLAPLFCMGYFHATRRRQITSLVLTGAIVLLVVAVRFLPQPWRGLLDAGVVVGLLWGLISLLWFAGRALTGAQFPHSPEVPGLPVAVGERAGASDS